MPSRFGGASREPWLGPRGTRPRHAERLDGATIPQIMQIWAVPAGARTLRAMDVRGEVKSGKRPATAGALSVWERDERHHVTENAPER